MQRDADSAFIHGAANPLPALRAALDDGRRDEEFSETKALPCGLFLNCRIPLEKLEKVQLGIPLGRAARLRDENRATGGNQR